MIVNMHMELGRTITIERTEPDFPIGDATTKFENELKSMHAAGDGKEVFCNGNWEGDFKEINNNASKIFQALLNADLMYSVYCLNWNKH